MSRRCFLESVIDWKHSMLVGPSLTEHHNGGVLSMLILCQVVD